MHTQSSLNLKGISKMLNGTIISSIGLKSFGGIPMQGIKRRLCDF